MKKWMLLLIFLVGCTIVLEKPAYNLAFSIQETGKQIDGNVYVNGNFIGRTRNGNLGVLLSNMSEGTLNFAGYYQNRPFNYSYSIGTEHLSKRKLAFSVDQESLNSFTMSFTINESKEPLDGSVLNNDRNLGNTINGEISVAYKEIEQGRINLIGKYRGKDFEFKFNLVENELKNSQMFFIISKKELESALFDAGDIDRLKEEQEIVRLVNIERQKVSVPALKWNSKAADVAYSHSLDMANRQYFAHQSPEGQSVGDRLKKTNVLYTVAAEDLSFFDNLAPDTNIAQKSVQGWMNSPGHRAPILDSDKLFSDAGVGVVCIEKTCYVTLVFIGNERSIETNIPIGYLSFYYLYDPNFGFDISVPLRVEINSTSPINTYIVSGRSQYEAILRGQDTDYIEKFTSIEQINEQYTANPGMGVVLENKGDVDADISLHIDYYP